MRRSPPRVHKSRGRPRPSQEIQSKDGKKFSWKRTSRRRPLPAKKIQNKDGKDLDLGRKKRRSPKELIHGRKKIFLEDPSKEAPSTCLL